ncbi:MAG: YjbQ family protein [Acidobacteriota bacterium]|nr:YjbQ family protein [Acidobacteriota bacterium]
MKKQFLAIMWLVVAKVDLSYAQTDGFGGREFFCEFDGGRERRVIMMIG